MKKLFIPLLLLTIAYSCKKQTSSTPTPPQPPFSYFKDTSSNKPTGLDTSSTSDLEYVPFVEDIDTFLIPVFGRIMSPPTWTMEVPPPGTQLYNSCVGWAIGHGMLGYQYKVIDGYPDYSNLDRIFSASYIWNQLNGGIDRGISLAKGLKLIKEQGCCKWTYMPANVTSYSVQPTTSARTNAANYKLSEFMRFKTIDIDLLKYCLSKNYPIPFGASVDAGFMTGKDASSFDKKQDGRLVWKQNSGATKGHAMLLCGYDDNINAFKVLNSWGTDWGNQGFFWIDYNFFKTVVIKNIINRPEMYLGVTRKYGTVNDIDGNVYKTVKIGNQEWMVENLKTTRYRNGDVIPNVTDGVGWSGLSTGAFCDYNNDGANSNTYGHLYNWYAVNDARNIAPLGWHVPTKAEWETLINYLGGDLVAGGKLKETGTAHWLTPNNYATNSSGFTALPGGHRNYSIFNYIGTGGYWWSSSQHTNSSWAWNYNVVYSHPVVNIGYNDKQMGLSIRCIKN